MLGAGVKYVAKGVGDGCGGERCGGSIQLLESRVSEGAKRERGKASGGRVLVHSVASRRL